MTTLDKSAFKLHTDVGFAAMQRRLKEVARDSPLQLDDLEEDFGYKYNKHGRLQDRELEIRLATIYGLDWMHIYLEGGIFDTELRECLKILGRVGHGTTELHYFLQLWKLSLIHI